VLPSKDKSELFRGQLKQITEQEWHNRLVYGDNLLVMQALLAGDPETGLPSMRGKIDLIYIDPPFDSKADYRTKITLPGATIEQKPTVLEQFAYSDTWKDGTVSYLQMIYPRLVLMRELLSEQGSIYVHLDWHVGHYVKVLMDEVFGKENFRNEIVWTYFGFKRATAKKFPQKHDVIYSYTKSASYMSRNALASTCRRLQMPHIWQENPGDIWYSALIMNRVRLSALCLIHTPQKLKAIRTCLSGSAWVFIQMWASRLLQWITLKDGLCFLR